MENIQEIKIRHFKYKESLTSIAKEYKVSRDTITKEFKKLGLTPVNYQNKVKIKQDIFQIIDNEEKAYWLGFIYADGCIGKGNGFELTLQERDKSHLEKLKSFIGWEGEIKYRKIQKAYRITFRNKKFVKDLYNLGVHQNKSLSLEFPDLKQVPEHLIKHFIRGYFDGDGCIHYRKQVIKNPVVISVLGTPNFLNRMREFIPVKIKKLYRNNKSEKTLVFQTSGVKAQKVLRYLYKDCNIYLDRKLFLAVLGRNL